MTHHLRAGRTLAMQLCAEMGIGHSAITGLSDAALIRIGTGQTPTRDARVLLAARWAQARRGRAW